MVATGRLVRTDAPMGAALAGELMEFWTGIFGGPPDVTSDVLLGEEGPYNHDTVYLTRRGGRLAGTCLLTVSKGVPSLGAFGEVATAPADRGSGTATELCGQAVEDFRDGGGQALFLGTGNPDAARIYHRLGWRKLAGAKVMALVTDGDSPEGFLVDYFRQRGPTTVTETTPHARVPMIPLMVTPHDWQVLDANAAKFSTRYVVQHRCAGLYGSYAELTADGRGTWLCAQTGDGRVVGMATARLDDSGRCRVDGFAHRSHMDSWEELIESAMSWGVTAGASRLEARLSIEDEEKRALFEKLGFRPAGDSGGFEMDGRKVRAVRLERG